MYNYLKEQEKFVINNLENQNCDIIWLRDYFKTQIQFLQHERFIHLIVTLFFSLLLLASIIISCINPNILLCLLDITLIILILFYIVHYYRLENGVQRWYILYNKIEEKIKK